jgi:hypothetical protein
MANEPFWQIFEEAKKVGQNVDFDQIKKDFS